MLLNCNRIICTAFVGKVVGEYHNFLAINNADTGNNISGRDVLVKASKLTNFEEW